MNWQPIETAPQDGSRVIVACSDGVWMAYWSFRDDIDNSFGKSFWSLIGCAPWDDHRIIDPTHWMPLPTPPKETLEP